MWRHLGALEVWQQDWTLVFGTAGHSVVYQGTASPGLSDASNGKHLFVSFLLFAGPTWAVAAHAPPLPFVWGLRSFDSAAGLLRGGIWVFSVTLVAPRLWWHDTYNTPNLDNLNLFEIALGRKPILVPRLESTPHIPVTGTFTKVKQVLEQNWSIKRKASEV